jgi:hypothetical protein
MVLKHMVASGSGDQHSACIHSCKLHSCETIARESPFLASDAIRFYVQCCKKKSKMAALVSKLFA